jgi:shikimate dehydrogenase
VYPRPRGGLLDDAAALGLRVQDGLPMLLWQGVAALELWLDRPLPPEAIAAMRSALENA